MVRDGGGDPIPTELSEVIRFYEEHLGDAVKFPDMDVDVLRASAEALRARAKTVEAARSALDTAKAELEASKAELRGRVDQALAYARIYSQGKEDLSSELEKLSLANPKGATRKPAQRRGRRKKSAPEAEPTSDTEPSSRTAVCVP